MTTSNTTFHPGQVLRAQISGALFTVDNVQEGPQDPRRGTVTAVYFRHQKTGQRVRVELETAQRLLLEVVNG